MFQFFKKKQKLSLPFEYITVPGTKTVPTYMNLQKKENDLIPIILGDSDSVMHLVEIYEMNEQTTDSIIADSTQFNINEFLTERLTEYDEFYSEYVGEWSDEPFSGLYNLSAHRDLEGNYLKEVYIGLFPANHSYEVPAYLKYGEWNDCPESSTHVGIFKYWYEKYKATIIAITSDTIECVVEEPPMTKEAALELAKEQFLYCTDIVTQGYGDIHKLAEDLLESKTWYFWWD